MRITILFGGTNKERLVSVASAQALHRALPEADLWFWHLADTVHEVRSETLLDHRRPFEDEFEPGSRGIAISKRRSIRQRLKIVCWCSACMAAGRRMASCRRCARCAAFRSPDPARRRRISPSTRWRRSASRRSQASRRRPGIALEDIEAAFAEHGRLIAKPAQGRIELRPDLRQCETGSRRRPQRREDRRISDRAVRLRRRGHLRRAGAVRRRGFFAAADRDRARGGRVRLHRQIPAEIDPGDLPGPVFAGDHRRRSWSRRSGRTGRCPAPAIPAPISSSRRKGRFTWRPIPCRA